MEKDAGERLFGTTIMSSTVIGIHPDGDWGGHYAGRWAETLRAAGAEVRELDLLRPDALAQARGCDGVMWRWAHTPQDKQSAQRILHVIEHELGIPVYPDSATAWHYDEKVAQFYLFQALGAPTPQTWIFWRRDEALAWAASAVYPVVFKLSCGAGASEVVKVTSAAKATHLINLMFSWGLHPLSDLAVPSSKCRGRRLRRLQYLVARMKDGVRYVLNGRLPPPDPLWWRPEFGYAYFQQFVPGNAFDTRITIIGDRAFGFRRFNRPDDFRASGSGLIDHDPSKVDLRCIETAFRVSKAGRFQSMAYDFLFDAGQPVIGEISYTFADWAVQACPGHWRPDLSWVEGPMWPETAQAEDFLKRVRREG